MLCGVGGCYIFEGEVALGVSVSNAIIEVTRVAGERRKCCLLWEGVLGFKT